MSNVHHIRDAEWFMEVTKAEPGENEGSWSIELSCGHEFLFGTAKEKPVKILCPFCKVGMNPNNGRGE